MGLVIIFMILAFVGIWLIAAAALGVLTLGPMALT